MLKKIGDNHIRVLVLSFDYWWFWILNWVLARGKVVY